MGRQLLVLSPKTVVHSGNTGRLLSNYLEKEVVQGLLKGG